MKYIAALALVVALPAHAEFITGNMLLERMNADNYVDKSIAIGYVMGVADAGWSVVHCMPPTVTSGQVHDMVKSYLATTPGVRHHTADAIIASLLNRAFPCAQQPRSNRRNDL